MRLVWKLCKYNAKYSPSPLQCSCRLFCDVFELFFEIFEINLRQALQAGTPYFRGCCRLLLCVGVLQTLHADEVEPVCGCAAKERERELYYVIVIIYLGKLWKRKTPAQATCYHAKSQLGLDYEDFSYEFFFFLSNFTLFRFMGIP